MFATLRSCFAPKPLLDFFKYTSSKKDNTMFSVTEMNKKFFITDRNGNVAGSESGYARRRDAFRGAVRRGLSLS